MYTIWYGDTIQKSVDLLNKKLKLKNKDIGTYMASHVMCLPVYWFDTSEILRVTPYIILIQIK